MSIDWMINEVKRAQKKAFWPQPSWMAEENHEKKEKISDSRCPHRDLNPALPEYRFRAFMLSHVVRSNLTSFNLSMFIAIRSIIAFSLFTF